jgi:hypothetical protein
MASLTSLIIAKLNLLLQFEFVGIHFSIETVVLFQYTCQASRSCVNRAPMRDTFAGVDFGHDVFKMPLPE